MNLAVRADEPFSFDSTPGQLPKTVVPRHYDIYLRPNLAKLITSGSETVEIDVLKTVEEIVLNALQMEVTSATLGTFKGKSGDERPLKCRLDSKKQTVALKSNREIKPGKYRLTLKFNGQLGEQAQGLFYVKYAAASGKKIMLGTQMEPSDARRMFPCWDEPVYRATFDLSIVVPQKHKAFSNMPIERETPVGGGFKEVKFARTPAMSSYLVAFVSGELEELRGESDGVQLRIVTTEGKRGQGRLALDAAKRLLAYYNQYFGIKYPLPKLDLIAIPGGFSGAMENWGAITFNESLLLFDPQTSSPQTRRDIFITVAHEMSHQWFGNLVTTAWWNDLWLNEGLASWMETKATDHFHPEWQIPLSVASEKSYVMNNDARSTTHPIQQPVTNESEANDAFDDITYQKGEAFLRMLEDYLGEETFRKGIHRYLSAHEYSNATTANLWDALEQVSGKPIRKISTGWTGQPGLPVVKVKTDCIDGKQIVSLEQERFTVQDPHAQPLLWQIPVALTNIARADSAAHVLLADSSASNGFGDCDGVIKANAGDVGCYRVQYAPELLARLEHEINRFPAADRLNLLDDQWAMVEAGRSPATHYLALVNSLRHETTFAIWDQVLYTFSLIDELEQGRPGRAAFQEFARQLLRPQFERLGWEKAGESDNDVMLRRRVIGALGHFGDQEIIAAARERFAKFLKVPATLPPDLRGPVTRIVGRYSDKQTYEQLHKLARTAQGAEERQLYYGAMAGALDPRLVKATLEISLTDETTPQEATDLVVQVAATSEQQEAAWAFAKQHMKQLLAKLDSVERNLYVPSILSPFSDSARADELEAYVQANISEDAVVKAKERAEGIRLKATLKQRELAGIDEWMAEQLKNHEN
jgi:aminopeptidase N